MSLGRSTAKLWFGHASTVRSRLLWIAVCCAALVTMAARLVHWSEQLNTLTAEQAAARARLADLQRLEPATKPQARALSARAAARHNLAVSQLSTPWSDVFDALERRVRPDVGLTLLEPDAKRSALRFQAEAKDIATLIVYAEDLAADAALGPVNLQQHETNDQDPNRPARLSFEVRLRTLVAEERP